MMMISDIAQEKEQLPELADNQIVLGRYKGKKTKPLNDSGVTKAYRNFRKTIHRKRTYDNRAAEALRGEITQHIRKELNLPDLELIQFVVDIHRIETIKDRQVQADMWKANPQMFYNRAEKTVFVEDKTHYFFKQELKEKRHQPTTGCTKDRNVAAASSNAATSPSSSIPAFATTTATTISPSASPDYYPTAPIASAISPSPSHFDHDEMNLSDDEAGIDDSDIQKMMNEDIVGSDTEGMSSDVDMDVSIRSTKKEFIGEVMKFEFAEDGGTLDEQVKRFCAHFCKNSFDMDEILRKSTMVTSFQSHFQTFQQLLSINNPFGSSPLPMLRGLPELLLIECATVMLNGMTEVYQRCPSSCLEGEADAWTGNSLTYASKNQPNHSGMLSATSSAQMDTIALSNALPMPAIGEEQILGSMRQRPDPPIDFFQNPSAQGQSFYLDLEDSEHQPFNPNQRYYSEYRSLGGLIRGPGGDDSSDDEGHGFECTQLREYPQLFPYQADWADDQPGENKSSRRSNTSDTRSLVFLHYAGKHNSRKGKKEKVPEPLEIKSVGQAKGDDQKKKEPEETSLSERAPLRSQEELYGWFASRLRREKIYRKNVTSFIRKAKKGERVVTVIDGKQETKYQVKDDNSWLVCGKAAGEYYSLSDQQFKANYDTDSAKDIAIDDPHPLAKRLRKQGFMEYRSSRKVRAKQVTENDMKFFRRGIEDETNPGAYFIAPWGESMLVEEGDYIVMQHPEKNREIYRIAHRVFCDSYHDDDEVETKEEKKQPVVLGSATLAVGAAVLVAALVFPKLMFSARKKV